MQKEILIETFTKKGDGAGRVVLEEGQLPSRVEIPHTMPQDRVIADLRKKRKRVVKGRLVEILTPSPFRVQAHCEHATMCGGCSWQCMEYREQLKEKERIIGTTFRDFFPQSELFPIIACDPCFHYRNKMEFSFSENRGGMRYLGLMIARAKRYVFNIHKCFLASFWFSDLLNATRKWWEESALSAYCPLENRGCLRTLTLREGKNTGEKMVILTLSHPEEILALEEKIESFVQMVVNTVGEGVSIFLRLHKAQAGEETVFEEKMLYGQDHIKEKLCLGHRELLFTISPSSFFQPNTLQAQKLFLRALEMVRPKPTDTLLDLYCGSGAVGMLFAPFVHKVIGIEENAHAVEDGRKNLLLNGIENFSIHEGDAGELLTRFRKDPQFTLPDIVVVDPPRGGLDALAIEQILLIKPKILLYISCNPATQIENIKSLQLHYRVAKIQPIDQFPHTPHIENIVLLERLSSKIDF